MNVCELFSGIGGMHFALKESQVCGHIQYAADINTTANSVYKYNFPSTKLLQRNIQSFTDRDFNGIHCIMMSPPCQPYTRLGLQKDDEDNRNNSLFHIIELIPQLKSVQFILLENVKGFETSRTRDKLCKTLLKAGFQFQEFLISPTSCHIPNSRLRYFILAKLSSLPFCFEKTEGILESIPTANKIVQEKINVINSKFKNKVEDGESCFRIKDVLCSGTHNLVPEKLLLKYGMILDIVMADSTKSCCFTKGYAHYIEGTGSVFTPRTAEQVTERYQQAQRDGFKCLVDLGLRFFSPAEVAKLMCFPEEFKFPENVSDKQKYRLLGNSVNVHVVALLTLLLVS